MPNRFFCKVLLENKVETLHSLVVGIERVIVLLIVGVVGVALPLVAYGEMLSFSLKPAKQEIILKPGQSVDKEIVVVNHLGYPAVFGMKINELNWPGKQNDFENLSLGNYLTLPIKDITIRNGETVAVPFQVSVPVGALPGGYYGYISVGAKAIEGSTEHSGVVMFCVRNANTANGVISVGYDSFAVYLFPQQSITVRCIGTAWEVV